MTPTYSANAKRVAKDLAELERIGKSQNGITRLAFTETENKAHYYIRREMEAAGMSINVDGAGNLYGLLPGRSRKSVVVASHLDTVPEGGNYDGAVGVVMGIEAVRVLKKNIFTHGIKVVAFRAEESSRFRTGHIGSKLATGGLKLSDLHKIRDKDNVTAHDAILAAGFDPTTLKPWNKSEYLFYIEPHIGQGGVLKEAGIPTGIVTGIAAPVRYSVTVRGKEDHSGATPMRLRHDALTAASEMILAVERIAKTYEKRGYQTRATVGDSIVKDGTINKVPGEVTFLLDMRGTLPKGIAALEKTILSEFKKIAVQRAVTLNLTETERGAPTNLKEEHYAILEKAAEKLSARTMRLPSGAGHDAQEVARLGIPTTLLFIRNTGGSHNPKESVDIKDVVIATNILIETLMEVASQ